MKAIGLGSGAISEKHLDPVFSEMGLNKDKLEQVVTRHQDEVRHYLKKQESKTAKRL